MALFWKESKKTVCSLVFILYTVAIIAMYASQFMPELEAPLMPPREGETYGDRIKETPEVVMPAATESLLCEYLEGSYVAYPLFGYKAVRLKESDSIEMAYILEELTGLEKEELDGFTGYENAHYETVFDENQNPVTTYHEAKLPQYRIPEQVTYERFLELMERADKLIGGGSKYSVRYLQSNFAKTPMTYEEALAEYEEVTDASRIAESYGRLYCDYMGILLSIMPAFVCAGLWQADKRSRMEMLVYTREISSFKLVLTRYLAMVCCMLIPVFLTFAHALVGVCALYPDKQILIGRALMLMAIWLCPSILAVTAIGALLSELVSPFFAIFIQGVWWYMATSSQQLIADFTRYALVIRHNTLGDPSLFLAKEKLFLENRIGYLVLAFLTVIGSAVIYNKARKGGLWRANRFRHQDIWKNH